MDNERKQRILEKLAKELKPRLQTPGPPRRSGSAHDAHYARVDAADKGERGYSDEQRQATMPINKTLSSSMRQENQMKRSALQSASNPRSNMRVENRRYLKARIKDTGPIR